MIDFSYDLRKIDALRCFLYERRKEERRRMKEIAKRSILQCSLNKNV